MPRILTDATAAAAARRSGRPLWFVLIAWPTFTSRLNTYEDLEWRGELWRGKGLTVGAFDASGLPGNIVITDYDGTYRTLMLTDGLRDRAIRVWHAYRDALGDDDPVELGTCVADKASIAKGKLTISLGRTQSDRASTPRERIGPLTGVNFTATPGEVVFWANQKIIMQV